MTSSIAKSCMSALSPHLMALIALDMTRIGLRVNLAADFVSLVKNLWAYDDADILRFHVSGLLY